MINPTPVSRPNNSPYSSGENQSRQIKQQPKLPSNIAAPKQQSPKKRKWKRAAAYILVILVVASVSFVYAQYKNLKDNTIVAHEGETSNILNYSEKTKLNSALFKKFGDGRFNVAVVGIGGENHPGGTLTDSIQVLSIDTINKKMTTTSVPRDLYVNIPGFGKAKINEAYQDGEKNKKDGGPAMVREVLGNVLGINISNFILIDFAGAEELVDAMGGIEVNVPEAIYDPTFPADNTLDFAPFSVKAGVQKMNGDTALRYSRSRHTTSDFDRSARQQLVMEAIKKKALSAGILSNPAKISQMVTTLGKHVKTDLQTSDIKTLAGIYKDIDSANSKGYVLDTSTELGLLTSKNDPAAGYISYPTLGVDNFSEIKSWFAKNSPDPLLTKESSTITVSAVGITTTKQAQALVDTLSKYGYTVKLGTASTKKVTSTQVYDTQKNKKPISRNYLGAYFSTTVQDDKPLNSGSDFEILYLYSAK